MTEYKLKMLFHCGSYDGVPLNGLAVYNDEEVYFNESNIPRYLSKDEYTPAILTKINEIKTSDNPDDVDDKVGFYHVCYMDDNDISVERIISYDIYRLPVNLLEEYKLYFIEFSENVGYHCWNDPQYYKPYIHKDNSDYYKNRKTKPLIDIHALEYLGTFRCDEFQYFYKDN